MSEDTSSDLTKRDSPRLQLPDTQITLDEEVDDDVIQSRSRFNTEIVTYKYKVLDLLQGHLDVVLNLVEYR